MPNRRSFLLGAAASALASTHGRSQSLTKVRYTLDWRYQGNLAGFMYAKTGGYFEKEGLDVAVDSGAGSVASITRIMGGSHDFGNSDLNAVITFMGNNPDAVNFKAVYLFYNRTPMIVQTLKRSGITDPKQLAGKTMASAEADATRMTFAVFARAAGFDPTTVKWINVDPVLRENLLARGDVDAIPGMEIDQLTLMERGIKREDITTFRYSDYGVNLYGNVLLASNKMIAEQPKTVAAFVRAMNHALIDTIANPEKAVGAVHSFDPLTNPKSDLEKLKIQLGVIDTPFAQEHGLGDIDKAALARQVEQTSEIFHLKTKPNPDQIFDLRFLPPKAERLPPKR